MQFNIFYKGKGREIQIVRHDQSRNTGVGEVMSMRSQEHSVYFASWVWNENPYRLWSVTVNWYV